MKVLQLVETINGKLITNEATKDNSFEGVYVGDLLSNVMANIKEDNLFVTIMCNINTIAVASLRDIPIIVFSSLINEDMKRKGEYLGANAQISKPEIGKLVSILDDLVGKSIYE